MGNKFPVRAAPSDPPTFPKASAAFCASLPRGKALAATALSLVISILAYAGYNLLVSRVESILLDMERSASALMNFMRQWRQNREAPRA